MHQEVIHRGEKPFKVRLSFSPQRYIPDGATIAQCTYERCSAAFLKHHQLRGHMASEHAPPGTKPYRCNHEDCTKSFSTNQKLRAHLKVHEGIFASHSTSMPFSPPCRRKKIHVRASCLQECNRIGLLSYLDRAAAAYPHYTPANMSSQRMCGKNIFLARGPSGSSEAAPAARPRGCTE